MRNKLKKNIVNYRKEWQILINENYSITSNS